MNYVEFKVLGTHDLFCAFNVGFHFYFISGTDYLKYISDIRYLLAYYLDIRFTQTLSTKK